MAEFAELDEVGRRAENSASRMSPSAIQSVWRVLDLLFTGTGYLAGALYLVLAFFVTYDVLARKWGSYLGLPTTRVTDEISGYMLALAATWGFAYALRTDAHVRVDVLFPYMGRRLRATMDSLALLLMAAFAFVISWKIWALVLDSLETGMRSSTYLLTPLYIPQGILGVGFSLLALAAVFMALASLAGWQLPPAVPEAENSADLPSNL
jgi:TRAP-type mannitol/chloroaromatic compound transport system permease small subunit